MVGGEGADAEVAADFVELAGDHGDQFVGGALAFDFTPAFEHGVDGFFEFAREDDGAGLHALEIALGEVVGDAGDVVHVAVREADVVGGEGELGTAADVEAGVELGELDDGLFAGDGVADEGKLREGEAGEFLDEVGALDFGGIWQRGGGEMEAHRRAGGEDVRQKGRRMVASLRLREEAAEHSELERVADFQFMESGKDQRGSKRGEIGFGLRGVNVGMVAGDKESYCRRKGACGITPHFRFDPGRRDWEGRDCRRFAWRELPRQANERGPSTMAWSAAWSCEDG